MTILSSFWLPKGTLNLSCTPDSQCDVNYSLSSSFSMGWSVILCIYILGVEFNFIPETDKPLVCDMSSNIMTREFDVSKVSYCILLTEFSCNLVCQSRLNFSRKVTENYNIWKNLSNLSRLTFVKNVNYCSTLTLPDIGGRGTMCLRRSSANSCWKSLTHFTFHIHISDAFWLNC